MEFVQLNEIKTENTILTKLTQHGHACYQITWLTFKISMLPAVAWPIHAGHRVKQTCSPDLIYF